MSTPHRDASRQGFADQLTAASSVIGVFEDDRLTPLLAGDSDESLTYAGCSEVRPGTRGSAEGSRLECDVQQIDIEMNYRNGRNGREDPVVDIADGRGATRMSGAERREHLLDAAEMEFASSGLQGTTTAALAKRAGITEPVLYSHFENKDQLFEEVLERGIEKRLRLMKERIAQLSLGSLVECVERMAELTVAACIFDTTNATLTAWALLEVPERASELHRREVGSVSLLWEQKLSECTPDSRTAALISMRVIPFSVQACVAYGFWLAVLRHNEDSARAIGREFAKGVALAAAGQMAAGYQGIGAARGQAKFR